jgi:hypothetical protein
MKTLNEHHWQGDGYHPQAADIFGIEITCTSNLSLHLSSL